MKTVFTTYPYAVLARHYNLDIKVLMVAADYLYSKGQRGFPEDWLAVTPEIRKHIEDIHLQHMWFQTKMANWNNGYELRLL